MFADFIDENDAVTTLDISAV